MASIWDSIAASIIKQAEPLIIKYLPEVKRAMKEAVREELESFFGTPTVEPTPVEPPDPDPVEIKIFVADMNTIPERMRQAGFNGRDGALYYSLAQIYNDGGNSTPQSDAEVWDLFARSDEIYKWWDDYLISVADRMKKNSKMTAKVITNDGRIDGVERLGCRLGPPTKRRLDSLGVGDRVQIGDVFPEEGY